MGSNKTNKSLAYNFYAPIFLQATGTDAYIVTFKTYEVHSYFIGLPLRVKFANANTGPCTINWNGFGAKSIKKSVTIDLVAGDIVAGGIYDLTYDGTNFQIMPPVTGGGAIPTVSMEAVAAYNGVSQALATPTYAGVVIINSASANGDSVLAIDFLPNVQQTLINKTPYMINIFPKPTEQIIRGLNTLGANNPYPLQSRNVLVVKCVSPGVAYD